MFPGSSSYGAGSGGRIGVYQHKPFDFRGTIATNGGSSSSSANHGGPGTIYLELYDGVTVKRILKVDGLNRGESSNLKMVLNERRYLPLDIVELKRQAMLSISQVSENISFFHLRLLFFVSLFCP